MLNTVSKDAISWLPDEVLADILSRVPTKLAASTSVLSKRWRNLFALVHNLDFDASDLLQPEEDEEERDVMRESFRDFVDRTLALQCGSPIKKFSLKCVIHMASELDCPADKEYGEVFLPSELFKSKTLICVTCFFLVVRACSEGYPYCISSRTIKKLSVHYDCKFAVDTMQSMSFDAPSLVSLDYSDYALAVYEQVNLESLVEARLDLRYTDRVISRCVKRGLFLPVFNKLVSLSFGSKNKRGWKLLPYLLKQCPKLETLIIQGLDGYTGDVTMRPFQVKVFHILGYGGTAKELEHLKSIIGESKCLELVQVEVAQGIAVDDAILSQIYRDLKTHLGVSSKCKIIVA
ncbi:PREDICTED: F-box/LRR-repeat protein At3g60040-like [Camelina sativa]|uniref:F-box/LRR-repeat protein At3g60040-like n=1 Tax=Camelina sativa TaxID=90675 RepID=A0ABM0ZCC9_CAMSA|nr:PREDICTED: F-box/LRR-repeat protein At3g60040-like [Camelina sativa]